MKMCQDLCNQRFAESTRLSRCAERRKMAAVNSLRKKTKGVQSLPRRQSIYHGMTEGSSQSFPPPPRVRPKDKSKVESLMKRRYSTRGVPQALNLEPFPAELGAKTRTTESNLNDNVIFFPVVMC